DVVRSPGSMSGTGQSVMRPSTQILSHLARKYRVCWAGWPSSGVAPLRLPRAHNGLGPVRNIQLVEDAIDVIANGFGTKRQLARDRGVVETARDQFEDLALAHGKIAKYGRSDLDVTVNETSNLGQELLPCRLVLQQNVIATLQGDELRAGNLTSNHATFRERYA